MERLANKVALVTGGAQGLGGATARRLAEEGATVLIADIDDEAADRRVASITAAGGVAAAFHADVGSHQDIQAMVSYTLERWQRLDILVNNAFPVINPVGAGSALEVSEEGWDQGMAVLTKSIFLAAKYAHTGDARSRRRQHRQHLLRAWSAHGAGPHGLRGR